MRARSVEDHLHENIASDSKARYINLTSYERAHKHDRANACVDLHEIKEPAVFFFALEQTVVALSFLRRTGCIHRDISPRNITLRCLFMDMEKPPSERYIMKLTELEHCKEYSRASCDGPITGTADYMAVEVQDRSHIFANNGNEVMLVDGYFAHNCLHDLESTVWIALEFVMRRVPRQAILSRRWPKLGPAVHELNALANLVFPNATAASVQRRNLLKMRKARDDLKDLLTKIYGQEAPIANLTDLLRKLYHAYTAVENKLKDSDVPSEPTSKRRMPVSLFEEQAGVYDDLRLAFQQVSRYYANAEGQDPLIPFSQIDFASGEFHEEPGTLDNESTCDAIGVNEQGGSDTTTATKRKAANDTAAAPRHLKRRRAPLPTATVPTVTRRTRGKARIDPTRPLRRSPRLHERGSGKSPGCPQ